MLILITGVPGSGKTLYAVGLIKKWLAEGREVYANIDGLQLPGVLPAPDDWRECPDGSVVVYDECQQRFGPDGAGRSGREDIQALEVHRHRGMDIVLITQHPKLLHAHIRRLVGRHYHLYRMYGTHSAKVFVRDGAIDVDKPSVLLKQDQQLWTYPTEDFSLYKSATIHTHKRQLPAWMKRAAIGFVAVAVLTVIAGWQARSFFAGRQSVQVVEAELGPGWELVEAPEPVPAPVPDVAEPRFIDARACIASASRCVCYGSDGRRLDLEQQQCREILSESPAVLPTIRTPYSRWIYDRPASS